MSTSNLSKFVILISIVCSTTLDVIAQNRRIDLFFSTETSAKPWNWLFKNNATYELRVYQGANDPDLKNKGSVTLSIKSDFGSTKTITLKKWNNKGFYYGDLSFGDLVSENNVTLYQLTDADYSSYFSGVNVSVAKQNGKEGEFAPINTEFFKATGFEKISISTTDLKIAPPIKKVFVQAKSSLLKVYIGHGSSCTGSIQFPNNSNGKEVWINPATIDYNINSKYLLLFGCAVLDIDDKNDNFPSYVNHGDGQGCISVCNSASPNPGLEWIKISNMQYIMGFNGVAPLMTGDGTNMIKSFGNKTKSYLKGLQQDKKMVEDRDFLQTKWKEVGAEQPKSTYYQSIAIQDLTNKQYN